MMDSFKIRLAYDDGEFMIYLGLSLSTHHIFVQL